MTKERAIAIIDYCIKQRPIDDLVYTATNDDNRNNVIEALKLIYEALEIGLECIEECKRLEDDLK